MRLSGEVTVDFEHKERTWLVKKSCLARRNAPVSTEREKVLILVSLCGMHRYRQ